MANPICLSPLKFYDALEKQERHKSYAYGHISPVIMPLGTICPFQLVLPPDETTGELDQIIDFYICDAKTNTRKCDLINSINEVKDLHHVYTEEYTAAMYLGLFPTPEIKFEGEYYIELFTNLGYNYYSEIIRFTSALDKYIEIEYWNPENDFTLKGGVITFANNFHFKVFLESELGKPEYSFEEEATKRLGYNFIESQISKKIYKFSAILPEYMCDALRVIRLCSNKILTSKGETHEMLSFEMEVDWQEQGDLASVNCEFEVDNVLAQFGGFRYEPRGGDFNSDVNNDFDIT